MGAGREVSISLDGVRDKNLMQLKKLNLALFPVRYNDKYYADALASGEFTKLGSFLCFFLTSIYLILHLSLLFVFALCFTVLCLAAIRFRNFDLLLACVFLKRLLYWVYIDHVRLSSGELI